MLVGSLDEFAALEACAGADKCDEFRCVDRAPAGLRRFDQLERHGQARRAGAGALGDSLAKPELARKFHDNAVRSLPEERAAEIAARSLALPDVQSVEDLTALLTSAGER